jgi:hypothetical protein
VQLGRVPGGDPSVDPGGGVELTEHGGDERAGVLRADPLVDRPVRVRQVQPGAPGIAVRVQRQRGQRAGADAVPDGVEQGDVHDVAVRRVVERVPAHVVAGLQDRRDQGTVRGEGQRGQLVPDDLGGELHRQPAPGPLHRVAVEPPARDQLRDQRGDHPEVAAPPVVRRAVQVDLEHAQAFGAVQQRQPETGGLAGRLGGAERDPGQGVVDLARLPVTRGALQRPQRQLLVVDQQHGHADGIEQRRDLGQRERQVLGPAAIAQVEQSPYRFHRVGHTDHLPPALPEPRPAQPTGPHPRRAGIYSATNIR